MFGVLQNARSAASLSLISDDVEAKSVRASMKAVSKGAETIETALPTMDVKLATFVDPIYLEKLLD